MPNPHHAIMRQALADCKSMLLQFGLTPAARVKLGAEASAEKESPFKGLIG